MAKKDRNTWTSEDIDNPAYSKKRPLSIKEQTKIYIDEPRAKSGQVFKKSAEIAMGVARLHPTYGIGMNMIDAYKDFKDKDPVSYVSNTAGAGAKTTYKLGTTTRTVGLLAKGVSKSILKGTGILFGAQDYVLDAKQLYNDVSSINFKNGGIVTKNRLRNNRLADNNNKELPKAFLGAAIGVVGGIAGSFLKRRAERKQQKLAEEAARNKQRLEYNSALTKSYEGNSELQDDYERRFQTQFKAGGDKKTNGAPITISEGGTAKRLGSNKFILRGRSHKAGGIVIGKGDNAIEAESGEVIEDAGNKIKIFSAQPMINGKSPAQLVENGADTNSVFNAQEQYKDMNELNDDGTKRSNNANKKRFRLGGNSTLQQNKIGNNIAPSLTGLSSNEFSTPSNITVSRKHKIAQMSSNKPISQPPVEVIRPRLKCGGSRKKAELGMSLTKGDWLSAGIGAVGNLASGVMDLITANKMKAPKAPILAGANKLKTNYNINPQLGAIERSRQSMIRGVDRDTVSSTAAMSRRNRISQSTTEQASQLYGQKENAETQMINQDALNQQQVSMRNVDKLGEYNDKLVDFHNQKAVSKGNAISNIVGSVTSGATGLIAQGQQRYNENQQISAIVGSNEKNNLKFMIDAGYNPDKSQLNAALSSATTQQEKDYYNNVLDKLYPDNSIKRKERRLLGRSSGLLAN